MIQISRYHANPIFAFSYAKIEKMIIWLMVSDQISCFILKRQIILLNTLITFNRLDIHKTKISDYNNSIITYR